ncbi:hypothetical protein [Streptomyces sp. NPDC048603]|uniref:hypothetical protein n=1 Tax=Streptomyces sp. NPDC048603 TaxID=3365577 RepID=UPI00371F10A6
MAVNKTEYRMWVRLARREDLPSAAFEAVVEGLVPGPEGFDPGWQEKEFARALPALFRRVDEQSLRNRLIAESGSAVPKLIRQGVVGGPDVPAVLRHHAVNGELVAALARHDRHRDVVTELVEARDLNELMGILLASGSPHPEESYDLPSVPGFLFDAILERALTCATAQLNDFVADHERETADQHFGPARWPAYGMVALILERCPERWPALVKDPKYGKSVQHTLLDHVDTAQLSDDVLAACGAAVSMGEWADLAKPQSSQRARLRHISDRVNRHPRLREMAVEQLHEASVDCLRRGRLLQVTALRRLRDHEATSLAHALALTSADGKDLAKIWATVIGLAEPTAVERRSGFDGDEPVPPKRLLSDDHRISALAALAANTYLDRRLALEVLEDLHTVEVRWLVADDDVPTWLKEAAARHLATISPEKDDPVPRVLSDEELDEHDNPAAVMQTWLDAVRDHRGAFFDQVEYAIIKSRHRTDALVAQVRAHIVLSDFEQDLAAEAFFKLCGTDPQRWNVVTGILTRRQRDFEETFGEFLQRLEVAFK